MPNPYESFVYPEVPSTESLARVYGDLMSTDLTQLPSPTNEEGVLRDQQSFRGALSWDDIDFEAYLATVPKHTRGKVLRDFELGRYNTHPEDPSQVDQAYKEAFWPTGDDISLVIRNPYGPTGYWGRGELWQHRQRLATDTLVVSSTDDGHFSLVLNKGPKTVLPGGFVNPEDCQGIMDTHVREVLEETAGEVSLTDAEGIALSDGVPVANRRMTDTAWVESHGALFIISGSAALRSGNSMDGDDEYQIDTSYSWRRLDTDFYNQIATSPQRKVIIDAAVELELIEVREK